MVGVLYRFGLLALVSATIFYFFRSISAHYRVHGLYATDFTVTLIILVALVAFSAYSSLGGQPVFKGGLLRD